MQQKVSTKERIIAAAKQLFAEQGFHATAMADLAGYAQVSVGTIYRSFASKSDIIRAIILADTEATLGQLQRDIDQVRDGKVTGARALEGMIFSWVSQRTDALDHEIVAEGHRNPEVTEIIASACGQYRDLFRTLVELLAPGLGPEEIEGVAELLLACLFGMGNRKFTYPRLDEARTATIVTKLLLQMSDGGSAS